MRKILKLIFPFVWRSDYEYAVAYNHTLRGYWHASSDNYCSLWRKHQAFRDHVEAYDKKHGTNIMAKRDEKGRFTGERW